MTTDAAMDSTHSCWELAVSLAAQHGALRPHDDAATEVFQVSTMSALVAGHYDGEVSYAQVMQHGDFGVGTFNALDGEMAAVDGDFFHLHSDGTVAAVDPKALTPFAAVTFFRAQAEIDVDSSSSRSEVLARIDETMLSGELFYAIRIDGRFASVTTRTAARQMKPYPRLVETVKTQVERELTDVSGTMIGFRAPASAQGRTVAGYHLHFVDDSRLRGGHVLDFELTSGKVLLDHDVDLHVELATGSGDAFADEGSAEDIAAEIERAENVR